MALVGQDLELFETVIRDFLIAIKNCILYDPRHPLFQYSVKKTRHSIEKWYGQQTDLLIGVHTTALAVNKQPIEKKVSCFQEIASMLHRRGILSVRIKNYVRETDLIRFVDLMKLQGREIEKMGGSRAILTDESAIQVKEIDYRSILSNIRGKYATEEEHVWAYLQDFGKSGNTEDLPESKSELLVRFFQDSVKSTTLLNRIYKRALNQKADEKVIETYQSAMLKVCQYIDVHKNSEAAIEFKSDLLQLVSQLHPDLVHGLLEHMLPGGKQIRFAEEITRDLPDNTIAGFMESLISSEGSVNEYLLRIFNKLVPESSRAENIAPILADSLFNTKAIKQSELSSIQVSIQELFKNNPEDSFISEMYRITVDSVLNTSRDSLIVVTRLTPEITRFVRAMEKSHLEKQRVRLLQNILLHESDPEDFKKFTLQMLDSFRTAMKNSDFTVVKAILLFYSHTLQKNKKSGHPLENLRQEALKKLVNTDVIHYMASNIPHVDDKDLNELATAFALSSDESVKVLLDQYLNQNNSVVQEKMILCFQKMKKRTVSEIYLRLRDCNPQYCGGLLSVLQKIAPDKLAPAIRKLIKHQSTLVQWEALRRFDPETDVDAKIILGCITQSKNSGVRKTAMTALLNSKERCFLDMLFKKVTKRGVKKDLLQETIEIAGTTRNELTFPFLAAEVNRQTFLNTRKRKNIRFFALKSMMLINQTRTEAFIKDHLNQKDETWIKQVRQSLVQSPST